MSKAFHSHITCKNQIKNEWAMQNSNKIIFSCPRAFLEIFQNGQNRLFRARLHVEILLHFRVAYWQISNAIKASFSLVLVWFMWNARSFQNFTAHMWIDCAIDFLIVNMQYVKHQWFFFYLFPLIKFFLYQRPFFS